MTNISTLRRTARVGMMCALVSMAGVATAIAAGGAGHRARLSEDLVDHLRVGSQQIDVIVHATRAEADALARRYQLRIKRYLKNGVVFRLTAGQLAALQEDDTQDHLSADIPIHSTGDVTAAAIGADQVWAGIGDLPPLSGAGVGVAVIDSGVDTRHAALRNRVIVSKDFTGGDGIDRYGHGTHVAAIIAGRRGGTLDTADYRGMAPAARIISLRVLDENGAGFASDVIEAIDWAVDNRRQYDIRVINLSLGAPVTQPYRDDPICEAVERAVAAGIVVVVAAGNYGIAPDGRQVYGSIATPGNDPNVITVGALDTHDTPERSDDTVAKYSSRGPTRFDLVLKPDLVAPGNHIVSAESTGSYLSKTYPQRHVAGAGSNAYFQLNGTSMAAGVVSGTVALLLEERDKMSPRDAKSILQLTSSFLSPEGLVAGGAGSLNALAATQFAKSYRTHLPITNLSGEVVTPGGFAFENRLTSFSGARSIRARKAVSAHGHRVSAPVLKTTVIRVRNSSRTILWGTYSSKTILWGTSDQDTILWGTTNDADTILWGTNTSQTILWGTSEGDTILWGTSEGDTILWGTSDGDTILWGTSEGDTILWGTSFEDALNY